MNTGQKMDRRARVILWVDGGAAAAAGLGALLLRDGLAGLYAFPVDLVAFIAAMNLVYATYSGSLAVRATRGARVPRRAIELLVVGNLAWVVACAGILFATHRFASAIGLAVVAFEGCFVASLAIAELRYVRPVAR